MIIQIGLDGLSGSPELTAERVRNRRVWLLNQPGWLLLEIERHPSGGSPTVWEQTWLFDRQHFKVHLIDGNERAQVIPEKILVQSGKGPWRPASTELRDDFYQMIETEFGPDWVSRFKNLFQFQ